MTAPPPPPVKLTPPPTLSPPTTLPPPPPTLNNNTSSLSLNSSQSSPSSKTDSNSMRETGDPSLVKINHKSLVNNQTFADVQFVFGKKILYAHSFVLQLRCPKLLELKGTPIKKKKGLIMREMDKDKRDSILLDMLGYLYADDIDFSKINVPDILQINAYAMEFECARLQWKCENHIREMLNTDNVYDVLIEANKVNQSRIKDFCFHFIVNHYDSFIANKTKTSMLGIELFQDAIAVNQQKELGTLKQLDLKPCPPSTLISDFKRLYETMKDSIEATIFRVGINGAVQYVTAHRALLAGQTMQLQNLCLSPLTKGSKADPEHIVVPPLRTRSVFDNISSEAFETLLKYVYYGSADIPPLHACELIPFTIDYCMAELQALCYKKIQTSINERTALPILGVTYIIPPEGKDGTFLYQPIAAESTKKDATDFILEHLAESDMQLLPRMFPKIAVDLVLTNQKKERVAKGLPVENTNSSNNPNLTPNASKKTLDKAPSQATIKEKKEKKEKSK